MIDLRYSDIVKNMNLFDFHVFGCGAIGSSVAIEIARLNASNIYLYDHDDVASHNIGTSMYLATQIGRRKVSALSEMISDINANADISYNFNILDEKSNIVLNKNSIGILAFDSMKSRLDIAKTLCKRNIFAIIDGRMGAETLQVYSLTNTDIDIYKNTWYSDEDGDKEPCTASATPYCANIAGSIIANNIAKITSGQPLYKEIVFHFPTMTMIAKS